MATSRVKATYYYTNQRKMSLNPVESRKVKSKHLPPINVCQRGAPASDISMECVAVGVEVVRLGADPLGPRSHRGHQLGAFKKHTATGDLVQAGSLVFP